MLRNSLTEISLQQGLQTASAASWYQFLVLSLGPVSPLLPIHQLSSDAGVK